MNDNQFDVIVAGGGTAGFAAAVAAARNGLNVLVIEELGCLGGTPTNTYVTPMMKTMLPDKTNLSGGLYLEILEKMTEKGWAASYSDGKLRIFLAKEQSQQNILLMAPAMQPWLPSQKSHLSLVLIKNINACLIALLWRVLISMRLQIGL